MSQYGPYLPKVAIVKRGRPSSTKGSIGCVSMVYQLLEIGLFIFNLSLALLGSHKHIGKKLIEYKAWNHSLDTIIEILLNKFYIYPMIAIYKQKLWGYNLISSQEKEYF